MSKKRIQEEDIVEFYDLATRQLQADREDVEDLYKELREYVKSHPSRYVELGETLARLTDLKMKQTGQVIDVFKTLEKSVEKEDFGSLDEKDIAMIEREISKGKQSGH